MQWRLVRHFSASRKITSLHPKTEVLLRPPSLTVFDGLDCFFSLNQQLLTVISDHEQMVCTHSFLDISNAGNWLQLSPLLKVGIVGVEMLTGYVLKQARNTHLSTSEFVDIIFKSVPYLATDKYRFTVDNDGYF